MTPNFNKNQNNYSNFKLNQQFTFSKNKQLPNHQNNINTNNVVNQIPINIINNENNNKDNIPIKTLSNVTQVDGGNNAKIYEILFNNKESYSINEGSPAIDKWSNLGKIFKENYKINPLTKELKDTTNVNLQNIFNKDNNVNKHLNLSKSLSQKDIFEKAPNINLPKKFFYYSETEKNEENNNVMLNNIKNDNYGKVQITGYEITDRSYSNSSSDNKYSDDGIEFVKKKKVIPDWAQDHVYLNNLITMKNTKENKRLIFGKLRINNLDLNLIFNTNKKSYILRGDSADWKNDNTNSSKVFKEDLINTNNVDMLVNKLDLDTDLKDVDLCSGIRESQIYNNFIDANN